MPIDAADAPVRNRTARPREILSRAVRFVRTPKSAIREAALHADVGGAFVVAAAVWAILGVTGFGAALIGDGIGRPDPDSLLVAIGGGAAAGLVGVGFTALAAACLHLSGRAVGGAGPFRAMQTVVGYSTVVALLAVPAIVAQDVLSSSAGGMARDASVLGTALWWTALAALGVKVLYRTPWRATLGALILALIGGVSTTLVSAVVLSLLGLFAVTAIVG